jgi:hypothetical protein
MGFLLPFSVLGYAFVLHAAWRRQAELALLRQMRSDLATAQSHPAQEAAE